MADISGILRFNCVLEERHNIVQVSSLQSGIYIYRITEKGSDIAQIGKWIKL